MRIVIDMQGAQTESRFRGIGRYTMSFTQAIVRNRGEHEVILAVSGLFPGTIESIRAAFDGLLPQESIRVWQAPGPVGEQDSANDARREVAELLREAFLASLQPDIIHVCSLFEGFIDDAVTSIGRFDQETPVSLILYDLIPLLNPDHYLKHNPRYAYHYRRKVESLRRASAYLAISDFTRQEGLDVLGSAGGHFTNISTAIEPHFQRQNIDEVTASQLRRKFHIRRPFVLFTGGADERKNLPRLIEAYAALPAHLRDRHQLLFAGQMPENEITRLSQISRRAGLKDDELILTGYVSDEELIQLYNLCKLFVFPSWHEGFGLPALEAMACGAPVIGASTSSLPEVIGLPEALFNPFDIGAISYKMAQALGDDVFRSWLSDHGQKQAKKFSWDETARRAIRAWEALCRHRLTATDYLTKTFAYRRLLDALANRIEDDDETSLIALSNCIAQNESAGGERQLLLDVSELCQRDAATGVQRVVRSYLTWLLRKPPAGFRVEPVFATREEGYRYARRFTLRFLDQDLLQASDDPVRWQRGDLFFGMDMQHNVQLTHAPFYRQLQSEGVTVKFLVYDLLPIQLANLFRDANAKHLHEQWLAMIAGTDGAVCISKATADAFDAWVEKHGVPRTPIFRTSWVHIGADIEGSKPSRGLPDDAKTILETLSQRPTFLCVSTLEPRKRQRQIFQAVEQLWQRGVDINLVFVGQQGWKIEDLAEQLRAHYEFRRRLFWLEGISDEYLEHVYATSTCLIAASLNEGFGLSLIEAARHGIPIIARDIPVFREVAGDHAYYFSGGSANDLADALKAWLDLYRAQIHPPSTGMPWSTWQQSTEKLIRELVEDSYPRRQLLVDVSELAQRDARTGIQRVVRSILKEWLLNPPKGYRVEPVYATAELGYRYARQFTRRFLGISEGASKDDPIDYAPGDVFFGLDLQPHVQVAHRGFYHTLRREGAQVKFMVYDLLSILMPQCFPEGADIQFGNWLEVIAESDGAICISKAVANDLAGWFEQNGANRRRAFAIGWFHLGADVDHSHPTKGFPPNGDAVLSELRSRPTILMVGTLEPRKGHVEVLDALEQLWLTYVDVNLVIVGKQGWMIDKLAARLSAHVELNKRLFWLEGISDEYLDKVYAASTCVMAASYGEGFGLPLIEAAQHKLPIIARDIPVFREVAGDHAYYFSAADAQGLAQSIKQWLALYREQRHPRTDTMPCLTWRESACKLSEMLLGTQAC